MHHQLFGVIEGFYGDPWSQLERLACIDALAGWGANTYVWAPKAEPRHRDAWQDPFTAEELTNFATLIHHDDRIMVSIGLTPGSTATIDDIIVKMKPVVDAGCRIITLCFDDLPVLDAGRRHRELSHGICDQLGVEVLLVPTHYAGTTSSPYLAALCDGLDDRVTVMWTGNSVVTDEISVAQANTRARVMGERAPLIWDNVPVNDAMMSSHLHLGPYVGRDPKLRDVVSGVLLNPMISLRASLPMIESACAWWRGENAIEAWSQCVDRDDWRIIAEATAYPGELHWPGDRPSRQWFEQVVALPPCTDPDISPWVESARSGARICLAAYDVMEGIASGSLASDLTRIALPLLNLRQWLQTPERTLGNGPRTRPVFTQDETGRFAITSGVIVMTTSIVENFVHDANHALSGFEVVS